MKSVIDIAAGCVLAAAAAAALLATTAAATAQTAQKQSTPSRVASIDPAQSPMPQAGRVADRLRENLKHIRLPPGFSIALYAVVPDARHMAVAPSTDLLFVGTRRGAVWAVAGRGDGAAAEVRAFAPSLKYAIPNGVCFASDGSLIVAELNRVLRFPAAASAALGADVAVVELVPQGGLIPVDEESRGHSARTCRVGPDGALYITLGQPYNVQPRAKLALYERWGIGGIVRMSAVDGSRREVYATGIRNSVGLDFNPKDGTLWFTDNQTDGMGDDIPLGEINRATQPGQFFGYPYIVSKTRITENGYDKDAIPADAVDPQVMTDAHAADLGLAFYTGSAFPARYRGGFFSAQHGSWNRSKPIGARVLFTSLKADGTADKTEVFAEGWLDAGSGEYRGRPVDVAMLKDGSLLVSDDHAGAIYRISYAAP